MTSLSGFILGIFRFIELGNCLVSCTSKNNISLDDSFLTSSTPENLGSIDAKENINIFNSENRISNADEINLPLSNIADTLFKSKEEVKEKNSEKNGFDSFKENKSEVSMNMKNRYAQRLTIKSMDVQNITITKFLSNSFLVEYMYYMIMGILKIGQDVSERKSPYFIQ